MTTMLIQLGMTVLVMGGFLAGVELWARQN
jgi:hypothetical protein